MKTILSLLTISTLALSPTTTLIQNTTTSLANNFYWINIPNSTNTFTFFEEVQVIDELPIIDITATTGIRTIESFRWLYEELWLPGFYSTIEPFQTKQEVSDFNIPVTNEWEEGKTLAPITLIDHEENTWPFKMHAKLSYAIAISKHPSLNHLLLKIIFLVSATPNIFWTPQVFIRSGEALVFRGKG